MAKLRYCTLCEREVEIRKRFNWLAFLLLLFFLPPFGGILYLFVYLFKQRRCPICGGKDHLTKSSRIDGSIYVDMGSKARLSSSRKTKSS